MAFNLGKYITKTDKSYFNVSFKILSPFWRKSESLPHPEIMVHFRGSFIKFLTIYPAI